MPSTLPTLKLNSESGTINSQNTIVNNNELKFTYTPNQNSLNTSPNLQIDNNGLTLNGMLDQNNKVISNDLGSFSNSSGISVDISRPVIQSITGTLSGTGGIGNTIQINVKFNQNINTNGSISYIKFNFKFNNSVNKTATASSVVNGDTLKFVYPIAEGDHALGLDFDTSSPELYSIFYYNYYIKGTTNKYIPTTISGSDGSIKDNGAEIIVWAIKPVLTITNVSTTHNTIIQNFNWASTSNPTYNNHTSSNSSLNLNIAAPQNTSPTITTGGTRRNNHSNA